jgi:hypothetical protein
MKDEPRRLEPADYVGKYVRYYKGGELRRMNVFCIDDNGMLSGQLMHLDSNFPWAACDLAAARGDDPHKYLRMGVRDTVAVEDCGLPEGFGKSAD